MSDNISFFRFQSNFSDRFISYILLICVAFIPLYSDFTWISTVIIIPLTFLYLFSRFGMVNFKLDKFLKRYIWIFIFSIIGSLNLISSENYFLEISRLIGVFLFMIIASLYIKKNSSNIWRLYIIIILKYIGMLAFTAYTGLETINIETRLETGREVGINANAYGYFAFLSLFIIGVFLNFKKSYLGYLFFFLILVSSLIINIYAASRSGLTFTLISSILILYFVNYKKNNFRKIRYPLIFITIIIFIFNNIETESYLITNRFTDFFETGEDQRLIIQNIGFDLFKNNLFGYGPGQFEVLLLQSKFQKIAAPHNSFLLMAVNHGIQGLLVFLSLFLIFMKDSLKLIRCKNLILMKYGYLFLGFAIMFFLYNFLYDFVLNLYIMIVFYLFYSHQKNLIDNLIRRNSNK